MDFLIIPILSGVDGADMFNLFFSLVFYGGLVAFVPAAIFSLLKMS